MKKTLILGALAAGLAFGFSAPAAATGKMSCSAPQAKWKSRAALEAQLRKQGWKVAKSKIDGGCYEVYGTDPKGNKTAAINVRCLEGVDLTKLERTPFDGRSL